MCHYIGNTNMAADEAETVFSYVPGQQILPTYIVEDGL